jgi:hypothetical protein
MQVRCWLAALALTGIALLHRRRERHRSLADDRYRDELLALAKAFTQIGDDALEHEVLP